MIDWASEIGKTVKCPNCGGDCGRDEVDVAVGYVFGPFGCTCGWSEDDAYNQLTGPKLTKAGSALDSRGGAHPAETVAQADDPWADASALSLEEALSAHRHQGAAS